ncbi:hypothetical protein GWK47_037646 [Chionoecetes opilio]|uniref:Uncharacterized protein n=1 Tax=Chionoecetes opilio TaxID=41210 RepID=A0A8J5D267_CHIOP|nr:hypothetical protein GWK47_037646 [Chionoecetes opilio]
MSGPEEEPRLASKDILEDHLVDMMAAGQPKQASSEFLLNPNASTLHHAVFEAVVSKQKAMILPLTPASSTSFKTTAATFLPVESELPGPQEGTRRILPL